MIKIVHGPSTDLGGVRKLHRLVLEPVAEVRGRGVRGCNGGDGVLVVRQRRWFDPSAGKLCKSFNAELTLIVLLDDVNETFDGVLSLGDFAGHAGQVEGDVLRGALEHELATCEDDEVVEEELDSGGGLVDGEDDGAAAAGDVVHFLDDAVGAGGVQP